MAGHEFSNRLTDAFDGFEGEGGPLLEENVAVEAVEDGGDGFQRCTYDCSEFGDPERRLDGLLLDPGSGSKDFKGMLWGEEARTEGVVAREGGGEGDRGMEPLSVFGSQAEVLPIPTEGFTADCTKLEVDRGAAAAGVDINC